MNFDIWATVKRMLAGFSYRQFLVFLFFLAVSAIFWLFTALNEVVEREVKIPVTIVNKPQGVIITTNVTDTISVTVVDKGFTFFKYEHVDGVSPIEIDFLKYATQSGYGMVNPPELQRLVVNKLGSSSKITEIKPERLEFYYNYGQSKKIPVKWAGNISPADNYYLDNVKIEPAYVTVYAQQQTLDTMRCVYTVDINEFNFVKDVTRVVSLRVQPGVKVSPDKVKVTIHPDILQDKQIEVPIRTENVPAGLIMRTFPSRTTVNYTAGTNVAGSITENDFEVVVDYNDLRSDSTGTCNVYLRTKPESVNKAHVSDEQVDFLIENVAD